MTLGRQSADKFQYKVMSLNLIVAIGADLSIGRGGDLLWHLREDLQHFKAMTMGHAIVMGRRTWESFPKGALPGRTNIVISRNPDYKAEGALLCPTLSQALEEAYKHDSSPFIIGGGTVYTATLPHADRLYLTEVEAEFEDADTFFPEFDSEEWKQVDVSDYYTDAKSGLRYRFMTLDRIKE